jgi:cysteinyl-tRNA synthetase
MADWLRRLLEARGVGVKHVKNITDVGHMRQDLLDRGEDKVVAAAIKAGKSPLEIAAEYEEAFHRDEAALNIAPAHVFPKATEHVSRMVEITEKLVDRGLAYEVEGHVFFDVAAFPRYGALSGNTGQSLLEGVRAEADPRKRDPRDFALWKAAEPGRAMKWPSPWGDGFPGWHIECSAMSTQHLGERFDIHTGGVDNTFPHHEDEIAQSEGALGHRVVNYWVHGQHLLVDGLKMAKSTGNVYTLPDLMARGFDPLAFRYLCTTVHYRHRLNFTFDSLRAAQAGLNHLRQEATVAAFSADGKDGGGDTWERPFWDALEDDLDAPRALSVVWDLVRHSETSPALRARLLRSFDQVLGFGLLPEQAKWPEPVRILVAEREGLREKGNFAEADAVRDRILEQGFILRDTSRGPELVPDQPEPPDSPVLHSSNDVPSWLAKPDELDFTVILTGRDESEALRRAAEAVLANSRDHQIELIIVDRGSTDATGAWLSHAAQQDRRVRAAAADHDLGTGAARNCGMKLARGRNVVLVDTSIEFQGDVLAQLDRVLSDSSTGIAGPFGVNTEDLRDFSDAVGPEVDAVEGYLMAFRRDRIPEVGLMDEKFRFYRHLDLDYSLAFREHGYINRIVPDLPLRRHAHTDWERTPEDDRDRLSKRNFYRFLKKHGHRQDLLLAKRDQGS